MRQNKGYKCFIIKKSMVNSSGQVDISRSDFFKLPLYKAFKGYFGHSNHVGFYDNIWLLLRIEKIKIDK